MRISDWSSDVCSSDLRDGCYGPVSSLGLTPDGLADRHFPIGMAVGVAVAALALGVRHLRAAPAGDRLLLAIGGLAAIRAVAAVWLPHLGDRKSTRLNSSH